MQTGLKILPYSETRARVGGYSRMQMGRLEKVGKFPIRVQVGENRIGWFEHEIDAWLRERAALRDTAQLKAAEDYDDETLDAEADDEGEEEEDEAEEAEV